MTFGLSAGAIAMIGAGATVASGVMSSRAAGKAADAQTQANEKDVALRREIYQDQTARQEPFRQFGLAGGNRLMYLLGLSPQGGQGVTTGTSQSQPTGGGVPPSRMGPNGPEPMLQTAKGVLQSGADGVYSPASQPQPVDRNALRAQLLSQYTRQTGGQPIYAGGGGENEGAGNQSGYAPVGSTVDEAGLNAAIDAQMAQQQPTVQTGGQQQQPAQPPGTLPDGSPDPEYGSLMKDFDADAFLANRDPGYQFRMDEGVKAMERGTAARGGLNSGRAMKDLLRFGQGLGSQEYGAAFNRAQINRGYKTNVLQSLLGGGQTATNQLQDAGSKYASGAGAAIASAGDSRASGYMGTNNALTSAIGGSYNMLQQGNQLMAKLKPPGVDPYLTGEGSSYNGNYSRM